MTPILRESVLKLRITNMENLTDKETRILQYAVSFFIVNIENCNAEALGMTEEELEIKVETIAEKLGVALS